MSVEFGFCVFWASLCLVFVMIFITRSMDAKFFAGILKIKLNEAEAKLAAANKRINEVDDLLDEQGTTTDLDKIYRLSIHARILLDADAGKGKP